MSKVNRDDFSSKTKLALAARANYRCSYTDCNNITCGPSNESSSAVNNTGVASHIYAAAPGGKRYKSDLTPEERSHITNGIWLCVTHSVMIDRDETTFTPEVLFKMKEEHEIKIQSELLRLPGVTETNVELFRLGDKLIFTGTLLMVESTQWKMKVNEFISGDTFEITDLINNFNDITNEGKCIISESLSDGRLLSEPPRILFTPDGMTLELKISPRTQRVHVHNLGSDFALNETGDFIIENGDIKTVSGIERLPQHIMNCLSTQKGEIYGAPGVGVNIGEYYNLFNHTTWLERILKLEVIYHSAIVMSYDIFSDNQTALACIERVEKFYLISDIPYENFFTVFIGVYVKGYGLWEGKIKVNVDKKQPLIGFARE